MVKSWITENINEFLLDQITGLVQFLGDAINNIFYDIVDFANSNAYVQQAETAIMLISLALIGLQIAKMVLGGYILETSYDSDEDPFNLLVRIAITVAVITNSGWIFDYFMSVSKHFADDLLSSVSAGGAADTTNLLLGTDIRALGLMAGTFLLAIVIVLISFIAFTVIGGIRGAELIAMKLAFPLFSLDLLSSGHERFTNFFTAYIVAFFTFSFQMLFYCLALASYASMTADAPVYFLSTMVWIYIAMFGPKSIEKYLFKTGLTQNASSGVRMIVSSAAMKLM